MDAPKREQERLRQQTEEKVNVLEFCRKLPESIAVLALDVDHRILLSPDDSIPDDHFVLDLEA